MNKNLNSIIKFAVLILMVPSVALADAGIPMIIMSFPVMLFALIPVTIIEAIVLSRYLKIRFVTAFDASFDANLASTFAGIPLAWLILLAIELTTVGGGCNAYYDGVNGIGASVMMAMIRAAWLCPDQAGLISLLAASVVTLIATFFISVWIEYFVLRGILVKIATISSIKKQYG